MSTPQSLVQSLADALAGRISPSAGAAQSRTAATSVPSSIFDAVASRLMERLGLAAASPPPGADAVASRIMERLGLAVASPLSEADVVASRIRQRLGIAAASPPPGLALDAIVQRLLERLGVPASPTPTLTLDAVADRVLEKLGIQASVMPTAVASPLTEAIVDRIIERLELKASSPIPMIELAKKLLDGVGLAAMSPPPDPVAALAAIVVDRLGVQGHASAGGRSWAEVASRIVTAASAPSTTPAFEEAIAGAALEKLGLSHASWGTSPLWQAAAEQLVERLGVGAHASRAAGRPLPVESERL